MVDRPPLTELTSNDIYEMSFSQFKYGESETASPKEPKTKHQPQCNDIDDCKIRPLEERVTCVMCNSILNSLSLAERSIHVNRCLDRKVGVKKKAVNVKRSTTVRLLESDDNDIAAIFSPGSSSSILAASASTMRRANARKIRQVGFDSLSGGSTRSSDILNLDCAGNAEISSLISMPVEENNTFEIFSDSTTTDGVIRKKHPPPKERINQNPSNKASKKVASRHPVNYPSNLGLNSCTDLNANESTSVTSHSHLNANMSAEELELFHLRLQLGKKPVSVLQCHVMCCICLLMLSVIFCTDGC